LRSSCKVCNFVRFSLSCCSLLPNLHILHPRPEDAPGRRGKGTAGGTFCWSASWPSVKAPDNPYNFHLNVPSVSLSWLEIRNLCKGNEVYKLTSDLQFCGWRVDVRNGFLSNVDQYAKPELVRSILHFRTCIHCGNSCYYWVRIVLSVCFPERSRRMCTEQFVGRFAWMRTKICYFQGGKCIGCKCLKWRRSAECASQKIIN
jgi:hypothetical protein